jgi:hypothetical protein
MATTSESTKFSYARRIISPTTSLDNVPYVLEAPYDQHFRITNLAEKDIVQITHSPGGETKTFKVDSIEGFYARYGIVILQEEKNFCLYWIDHRFLSLDEKKTRMARDSFMRNLKFEFEF